ncbi:class I SAM-dependent methyltransferase [Streptomyces sp900116325]|uniref:class I SAM-dependent methyltransferase n=1 Tax=Streptomyces sp. 900116325 TaxID=3154295 RepID=UPI0033A591BF
MSLESNSNFFEETMDQSNATQKPEPDLASTQRDPEEESVHRALEGYYHAGKAPWDTGVTPPELVALVAGHGGLPPGRALELGCGTGTNAIYLARHGWEVAAVDLIDRAVDQAREKAAEAGVAVRLLHGDATRLDELDVPGPFDLFFDLSCYCGVPLHRRDAYAAGRHPFGRRSLVVILADFWAWGGTVTRSSGPRIRGSSG